MKNPQYILITLAKIVEVDRQGRQKVTVLQPPVMQLRPLPLTITRSQHGDKAEIDGGAGAVLTLQELFTDVLAAIEDAGASERTIATPIRRETIEASVSQPRHRQGFPMPVKAGAMLDEARDEAARVQATDALRDTLSRMEAAAREDEGAKHQGEQHQGERLDELAEQGRNAWSEFVQTEGENVGAPAEPRKPVAGDLRIAEVDGEFFWIEIARVLGDDTSFQWSRHGVPVEILPRYQTREAARQAVKLAGYIRRLIED